MAIGRIALGAAAVLAPGPSSRLLGFPAAQDSPSARLMGRLFGVRDVALGALVLKVGTDPAFSRFSYLLNAVVDGADAASMAAAVISRQGIDRAAISSAIPALGGMSGWLALAAKARVAQEAAR